METKISYRKGISPMIELYNLIPSCNPNRRILILTALNGNFAGKKAMFMDGALCWESPGGSFFSQFSEKLPDISSPGIISLENTKVFCEFPAHEPKLVICGGGHVSIPIIQIGRMIGCSVTVLEDRPKFADNARRAGADNVLCEPFEEGLKKIPGGPDTYFVIVTRGHRYDEACLAQIIKKEHAYIGMMGSRIRTAKVKQSLLDQGADSQVLESVHTPIGLPIGGETPEEIGVSIIAEIIQVKNRCHKHGGFTKEILNAVLDEKEKDMKKVLATIVTKKGSSPREAGTKMLIYRDGRTVGTIGGGCLEADIFQAALHLMSQEKLPMKLYHADMTGKHAEEEGMVCGGTVEVLLEIL